MFWKSYFERIVPLIFATTFFASGLLISSTQCLLFYTLRRFDKGLYRKINYYLTYTYYSELLFLSEWWAGIEFILYMDQDDCKKYMGKEKAFIISNHTYEVDWFIMPLIGDKFQVMGNFKAYAKKAIKYLPIFGWVLKFDEYIFLERNFEKDRNSILEQIKELGSYEDPVWVILYPEGTRFTQAKHEASLKFSEEKGLPILKHHLQPRTKGFTISLDPMRGKFGAIYDVLAVFDENELAEPKITNILKGKKIIGHVYLERIPLESVPKEEDELNAFLRDLFIKKDRMKESFINTRDFFEISGVKRVDRIILKRRFHALFNMIFWVLVVFCPLIYLLIKLFLNGNVLYLSIIAAFVTVSNMLLNNAVGMSSMETSSSYGMKTQ